MEMFNIQFRFAHLCLLCNDIILKKNSLCTFCEKIFPTPKEIQQPEFDKTIILFNYTFPFNRLITQLKFREDLTFAKLLGDLFVKSIPSFYLKTPLPQLIIPVPLHRQRLRERGFNQSLEIAKIISRQLLIPIDTKIILRSKNTRPQSSLSKSERLGNLKNAFALKQPVDKKYTHIVLIDDVITTGQTLKALAKILKQSGVKKIDAWCAAQTRLP